MHNKSALQEPDVWIEYQRADLNDDSFSRKSMADAIHRYDLMPDGCQVRTRQEGNTTIWEYKL